MIDRRTGSIKVRRGTEEQRIGTIFELGEFVYITDRKRLYIGDGTTYGGILVSNKNHIISTVVTTVPYNGAYGDIIHDKTLGKTYIVGMEPTGELNLILIYDTSICINLRSRIIDLWNKINELKACLGGITWTIQPFDVTANVGDTVMFTASAIGTGSITYQWNRKDTGPLLGKTSNTLSINPVLVTDYAGYQCVATDSIVGTTSSNVVYLDEIKEYKFVTTGLHTLALGFDGTLSAWGGYNVGFGLVGNGTTTNSLSPIKIHLSNILDIAAGYQSSYALGIDGTLSGWGRNSAGELGNGTTTSSNVPIKINLPPVKQFYIGPNLGGSRCCYALGVDGTLSAWGSNSWGEYGNGTTTGSRIPIQINLPPFEQLHVDANHCCFAIGFDGGLSAWARNNFGQHANGTIASSFVPIKINLPPVKQISTQRCIVYALGVNNTLSAWGRNTDTTVSLGDGTTTSSRVPIKINLPPIKKIASNMFTSYALGFDGSLSAWGGNNFGQLGDGTTTNSKVPIKINLPPVKDIYAGVYQDGGPGDLTGRNYIVYVLGFNGILSAWGNNKYGTLGNGTTTDSNVPINTRIKLF
jgi:alpha-tubulin suppressor-like RCC1 family protein